MPPKTAVKPGQPSALSQQEKIINIAKALVFLVLAGLGSTASQLNLSPVYGSIPAALFHQKALTGVSVAAFMLNGFLKRRGPRNISQYLGIIAYWIPTTQFFLFKYSSKLGPTYGPIVTELFTYFPLLLLAIHSASSLLEIFDLSKWNALLADMVPAVGSYAVVSFSSKASNYFISNFMGSHDLLSRIRLNLIVASIYAALSSTKTAVVLCLPAMIHTLQSNTHFNNDRALTSLNETLHTHRYSILARQESNTGYVSVLESWDNQFRVMRCDHSLLGGNWLATPERQKQGQTMPETIYSVFTMLEAVRLVDVPNKRTDEEKSALFIGLGIGTAPTAFINHGINTTIVELDPMVHYYATEYFGLPKNHIAAIQDAITFVDDVAENAPGSYDYVVHDVFTGGAEPVPLFTLEFLTGLKKLAKDDGVVAINYAGDLALSSTQTVLNTIHHVFPLCRLFRDSPKEKHDPSKEESPDFINMIVFCLKTAPTPSNNKKARLRFRKPTESDFAGSIARRNSLYPKPELEIKYKYNREPPKGDKEVMEQKPLLTRAGMGAFAENQKDSALSHWAIMRTVLPDAIWENW